MAKIEAHSSPSSLPGNSAMNAVTVKVRKPSTGTDWRMSRIGIRTFSARRLRAAAYPYTRVKTIEKNSAMNIRSRLRAAS